MLRNYLVVALRSIKKQKGLAIINVFGLGCGIALCLLIILFNQDELSFDRFHENHEQIHRVERFYYAADGSIDGNSSNDNLLLAEVLKNDIPEVQHASLTYNTTSFLQINRDKSAEATEEEILFTNEEFLAVFPFKLVQGQRETALEDPRSIILSESAARKHFGTANAVGEFVQLLILGEFQEFEVSAIAEDHPKNSSVKFDVIARIDRYLAADEELADLQNSWTLNFARTYVQIAAGASDASLRPKLDGFTNKYRGEEVTARRDELGFHADEMPLRYIFRPIAQVHFQSSRRPLQTYLLPVLAFLILTMACINFTMLAIGRSAWRAREVGVRKVVGANKIQLMVQFWSEALLLSIISAFVGLLLANLFLPAFNALTDKTLSLGDAGSLMITLTGLVVFSGFLAGSYPAVVLSSLWPVKALSGRFRLGSKNKLMQSLVVVQFTVTAFLLVGALVLGRQIQYLSQKDLGFNHSSVVTLATGQLDGSQIAQLLRNQLMGTRDIVDVTASGNKFGYRGHTGVGFRRDNGEFYAINMFPIESNHIDFFGLKLKSGRNFDPAISSDTTNAIIVNEALVRAFDLQDPIGKQIPFVEDHEIAGVIVGVVEDYNYQALYQEISPAMLTIEPIWRFDNIFVMLGNDRQQGLAALQSAWHEVVPEIPFTYEFLDDQMAEVYAQEERIMLITRYAALFAILIACLGLLGLTALTITGRMKEIGIRKVLGASAGSIVRLVSKEFGLLVIIGFVIASPAVYFFLENILSRYEYRVALNPLFFLQGALLLGVVAFATMGILAYNAAQRDPVDSLRYE
ncbi:MAG: ABC transporter permease [Rhodothermales bacterium]